MEEHQREFAQRHARRRARTAAFFTDAERRLWSRLRGGRLGGLRFRRQHPVPLCIADFCCAWAKLIVELDGSRHAVADDFARASCSPGASKRSVSGVTMR